MLCSEDGTTCLEVGGAVFNSINSNTIDYPPEIWDFPEQRGIRKSCGSCGGAGCVCDNSSCYIVGESDMDY